MSEVPEPKKKPDRQHAAKGASFHQFARLLRKQAKTATVTEDVLNTIEIIATAADETGRKISHLR